MFLRLKTRRKDGKEVLYLDEINDSQHGAWRRALDVIGDGSGAPRRMAIFPEDRAPPATLECDVVQVRLSQLALYQPRQ